MARSWWAVVLALMLASLLSTVTTEHDVKVKKFCCQGGCERGEDRLLGPARFRPCHWHRLRLRGGAESSNEVTHAEDGASAAGIRSSFMPHLASDDSLVVAAGGKGAGLLDDNAEARARAVPLRSTLKVIVDDTDYISQCAELMARERVRDGCLRA